MDLRRCRVPASMVWTSPDSPRAVDSSALLPDPDVSGWLAGLDGVAQGRLGLHGLVKTQLQAEEPVRVLAEREGWTQVVALWQPSRHHPHGYPGWVPSAHLVAVTGADGVSDGDARAGRARQHRDRPLDAARSFLGLPYLWGGCSEYGLDCSGLVHLAYRRTGRAVPRDAQDQARASTEVPPEGVRAGDLCFFGRRGGVIDHVGFATGGRSDGGMPVLLHAPETGVVEEVPMPPERRTRLVGVGRL